MSCRWEGVRVVGLRGAWEMVWSKCGNTLYVCWRCSAPPLGRCARFWPGQQGVKGGAGEVWGSCEHVLETQSLIVWICAFWPVLGVGRGEEKVWDECGFLLEMQCATAGKMYASLAWTAGKGKGGKRGCRGSVEEV